MSPSTLFSIEDILIVVFYQITLSIKITFYRQNTYINIAENI